jgi:hypothetical protein
LPSRQNRMADSAREEVMTSKVFRDEQHDWSPGPAVTDDHVVLSFSSGLVMEVLKMPAEAKSWAVEALVLRRRNIKIELARVECEIITVKQDIARLEDQIDHVTQGQRQAA